MKLNSDERLQFRQSEVALDFNAGFQSATAGILHHVIIGRPKVSATAELNRFVQSKGEFGRATEVFALAPLLRHMIGGIN